MSTVVDSTVLWCVMGEECDGSETCNSMCFPKEKQHTSEYTD